MKEEADQKQNESTDIESIVIEIKRRMLEWPNPVEYVNNMYGCHPGNSDIEYFQKVFHYENKQKS